MKIKEKIQIIRQHQYFRLYAAIGLLILAIAAYLTVFNRSTLVVILDNPQASIQIDGRVPEDIEVKGNKHIIHLWPGVHTLRITSTNTVDYAQTISLYRGLKRTINPVLNLIPKANKKFSGDAQFIGVSKKDPDTIYYLGENSSKLFKHNLKNNQRFALNTDHLINVQNVSWSPDFKLAIIQKVNGFYLYDFGRYNLVDVDVKFLGSIKDITMPAWDPLPETISASDVPDNDAQITGERRIAYFKEENGQRLILFANQLNEKQEKIIDVNQFFKPNLVWSPDGQNLIIYSQEGLAIFNLPSRQLNQIFSQPVTGVKFSQDSRFFAFTSEFTYVVKMSDYQLTNLGLSLDINRFAWNKSSDFLTLALANPQTGFDEFYRFDIRTSEKIKYTYSSPEPVKVKKLILKPDEATVLFESNDRLYSLILETES